MGSEKQEEEGKIPVLTVLKNNTILKNIFIVNKPPEESRGDHVDVLLVGRHPDCDVMLTHPSISRYHLQIRSKPSTRHFSVVDLSSVHGTWVSGRRIEAMVSVEMREGDSLRIGASSRVYRLHWIPISRAYDMENPFVAQLDAVAEEEEEEEEMQNLNSCHAEMEEIESVDSVIEDISSLFLHENAELAVKEDIPSAPWMLKDMVSLCFEEERKSPSKAEAIGIPSDPFETKTSYLPMMSNAENKMCDSWSQVLSPPPYVESVAQCDETLTEYLCGISCLPSAEDVLETKVQQFHTPPNTFASPSLPSHENSFEKHYSCFVVNTALSSLDEKSAAEAVIMPKESECILRDDGSIINAFTAGAGAGTFDFENLFLPVEKVAMDSLFGEEKGDVYRLQSQLLDDKFCHDHGHSLNEIVQDVGNKRTGSVSPIQNQIESVNLSMPQEPVLTIKNENQTLQSDMEILESCVKAMEKTSSNHNIWSRRGKAASAPHVRTSKSMLTIKAANVDTLVEMNNEKDIINKTISMNLLSVLDGGEVEEVFTPDKENSSPNTLQLQFLKGKEEEIKHSKSQRSRRLSKGTSNCDIYTNVSIGPALCKASQNDTKNKTISKDLFSILDGEKEDEIFTPDKENVSPNALQLRFLKKNGKLEEIKRSKSQRSPLSKGTFNPDLYPNEGTGSTLCQMNQKDILNRAISKDLFSDLDGEEEEEEMFTPDKENVSPNALQLRFQKKKGKLEEIKRSKSQRSPLSKGTFNPDLYSNEGTGSTLCQMKQKDILNRAISKDLFSDLDGEEEEEEMFTPDKENFSPNTLQLQVLKNKGKLEEIKRSKSQRLPLSKGTFKPDLYPNEGMGSTLCQMNQKDILNRAISKDLFSDLGEEEEEEEMFTPDKENFSPNTLQLQLLKKKGKVEEIKLSKSPWPQNSKDNFGCNIYPNENMSSTSSKEYQTAKVTQGQNLQRNPFSSHIKLAQEQEGVPFKNRVERVPLQSLKNSGGKRRSSTFCPVPAAKSFNFSNCGQILDQPINPFDINGVPKRSSWDMIVDTTSLMNKESRKALQLLQGLKGTRLIIPRLVIRELDSMKQQFSIFRRISEASLALEWIQECMVKTNWWIHIQNSVDEGRMIAPTPPASPQTQFSEECWTFLSSQKCAMEIASPTVEDHILEFALLYRKNQNDGQLVLLSEDVTLKIKCMEEGLLCEPVQEFRESLVNPFSERFLWTNSSPRGQTWSCQDDVVLREKYCRLPLWKSSKGVASGLKLILLHNSQYGL
ncbi:FHA domain-containing protein PS1 [Cajanus cajan]|uniref:FHA domain-containing protein PS1 n=1 Tax=Cajanus cajan TaxID=3821 RepID=UPI00098DA279|nr:FHA domain-containing protein PS1 [Cajanus cajan]XP_029126034.1 FHA domain-containing protein PS1 [Cajanus cajan]